MYKRQRQSGPALDRINFARQMPEHRRLITGAGADFKHALVAGEFKRFTHRSNHVRLRDRLPFADRQRRVVIRARAKFLGHKFVAWHAQHRFQHVL